MENIIKLLKDFGKEIDLHRSAKCGLRMCDECKALNDTKDECLEVLKKDFNKLKKSITLIIGKEKSK